MSSTSTSLLKISIPDKAPDKAPESKVPAISRITNQELPPHIAEKIHPHDQEIIKNAQGTQIDFHAKVEATCAFCLQQLNGMITMTKCGHFFCQSCQQEWQKRSDNWAVCRQPLAIQSDADFYDSDGPVYEPTADDIFELTEEEAALNAEVSRYMDELEPPTEQESSLFQYAEWYDDISSDDMSDDMSEDDDDMVASHENFQEQRAIYNSITNLITI